MPSDTLILTVPAKQSTSTKMSAYFLALEHELLESTGQAKYSSCQRKQRPHKMQPTPLCHKLLSLTPVRDWRCFTLHLQSKQGIVCWCHDYPGEWQHDHCRHASHCKHAPSPTSSAFADCRIAVKQARRNCHCW